MKMVGAEEEKDWKDGAKKLPCISSRLVSFLGPCGCDTSSGNKWVDRIGAVATSSSVIHTFGQCALHRSFSANASSTFIRRCVGNCCLEIDRYSIDGSVQGWWGHLGRRWGPTWRSDFRERHRLFQAPIRGIRHKQSSRPRSSVTVVGTWRPEARLWGWGLPIVGVRPVVLVATLPISQLPRNGTGCTILIDISLVIN